MNNEECGLERRTANSLNVQAASWRVAGSLEKLLAQINAAAPRRSKASDGGIGDPNHQNRNSDHNPWCGPGVVTARDYTHDPKAGADMHKVTEGLRKSNDPRIKYVIWNRRIFSSTVSPWTWRAYNGSNQHTLHAHVSVNCGASEDSTKTWNITIAKPRKRWRVTGVKRESKVKTGWKATRAYIARLRKRGFKITKKRL